MNHHGNLFFVVIMLLAVGFTFAEENFLRGAIKTKLESNSEYCDRLERTGNVGDECDFVCPCNDNTPEGDLNCHPGKKSIDCFFFLFLVLINKKKIGFFGMVQRCYHVRKFFFLEWKKKKKFSNFNNIHIISTTLRRTL